jgi:hypothetical protein
MYPDNFMIYGQLQYYHDELEAWFRIIDFHKSELRKLLTQLNVLLNFPLVSLPVANTAKALIDQLMVQEQRFDDAHHHFEHQAQRFEHAIASPDKLEPAIVAQQERCRNKMKTYELAFVNTKYDCLVFLSGFFQPANSCSVKIMPLGDSRGITSVSAQT